LSTKFFEGMDAIKVAQSKLVLKGPSPYNVKREKKLFLGNDKEKISERQKDNCNELKGTINFRCDIVMIVKVYVIK